MASRDFRSKATVKLGKEEFHAGQSFSPGRLPTHRQVMERMIFHQLPSGPSKNLATPSKDEAAFVVAEELTDHWIRCNVYTMTNANTKSAVLRLYSKLRSLTSATRRWGRISGGSGRWDILQGLGEGIWHPGEGRERHKEARAGWRRLKKSRLSTWTKFAESGSSSVTCLMTRSGREDHPLQHWRWVGRRPGLNDLRSWNSSFSSLTVAPYRRLLDAIFANFPAKYSKLSTLSSKN